MVWRNRGYIQTFALEISFHKSDIATWYHQFIMSVDVNGTALLTSGYFLKSTAYEMTTYYAVGIWNYYGIKACMKSAY
jgi:hypothetical protein